MVFLLFGGGFKFLAGTLNLHVAIVKLGTNDCTSSVNFFLTL